MRRCKYAARCAKTPHKGVLRGNDVEESVELEAKKIVRNRSTIPARMSNNLLPDVEAVLFVFPHLFAAELTDGCAPEQWLHLFGCNILYSRRRIVRDPAVRKMTGKKHQSALLHTRKEPLKIVLLLPRKGRVVDHRNFDRRIAR